MKLVFDRRSGNSYTIRDATIEADAELLGGGAGMLVILHSIKGVTPPARDATISNEELIGYLASEIKKQKRFGNFVLIYKGKVAFSLDKSLREGSQVPTAIRQKS